LNQVVSKWKRSDELFERSKRSLAGGVSSPFRRNLARTLFFEDGRGPELRDVDGNCYIDYVLGWGPMILGHKHPAMVEALRTAAERPHNYGAQHELECVVSEQICSLVPCAERVALTSSGSEAVQLAMRLARGFTGRNLIVKFEGHYHGWMDSALVSYHPTAREMGPAEHPAPVLGSRGQVQNARENLIILPWNEVEAVRSLFASSGDQVAAVVTEPVLCNSGSLMPAPGFLAELRRITEQHRALLIFDEVITGFRIAPGGAQSVFGVTPDVTTLGKAVGGGVPLSVVAGRREIMEMIIEGGVVFGGTFNGNPLSLAGAHATLNEISRNGGEALAKAVNLGEQLMAGLRTAAKRHGIALQTTGFGTAFSMHFTERTQLATYRDTLDDDLVLLRQWLRECLEESIYLLPDGRIYVSVVHTSRELDRTLSAFDRVLARCAAGSLVSKQ
jgi:glutamate-1-semialdehyde 2,1-aminomutase